MENLVFDTAAVCNFGHRGELTGLLAKLSTQYHLLTTPDVVAELTDPKRKAFYDAFLADWFEIRSASAVPFDLATLARFSQILDPGEISVMALAKELKAIAVLDEGSARREADRIGIQTTGTFDLLQRAALNRWMNEADCLARIHQLCSASVKTPRPAPHHTLAGHLAAIR